MAILPRPITLPAWKPVAKALGTLEGPAIEGAATPSGRSGT